jgi:hypothetical protein
MKETPFPIDVTTETQLSHCGIRQCSRRDEIELRNPAEISSRFIQPLIRSE